MLACRVSVTPLTSSSIAFCHQIPLPPKPWSLSSAPECPRRSRFDIILRLGSLATSSTRRRAWTAGVRCDCCHDIPVGRVVWTLLRSVVVSRRLYRLIPNFKSRMALLHAHGRTIPGVFVPTVATGSEATTIRLVRFIRLGTY